MKHPWNVVQARYSASPAFTPAVLFVCEPVNFSFCLLPTRFGSEMSPPPIYSSISSSFSIIIVFHFFLSFSFFFVLYFENKKWKTLTQFAFSQEYLRGFFSISLFKFRVLLLYSRRRSSGPWCSATPLFICFHFPSTSHLPRRSNAINSNSNLLHMGSQLYVLRVGMRAPWRPPPPPQPLDSYIQSQT